MTVCYTYCFGAVVWTAALLVTAACVCVLFPFILDVKFVECTSRGQTRGRSHRISHPHLPFAVVVVVVVVFTLKTVPISTQYVLTSVLVQLTRTPSSVITG